LLICDLRASSDFGTGLDLTKAYYGTAMFDNCQANEGIGFVRPVYSLAFWSNPGPGLSFITQFYFSGGAGQATFTGANDTDTSDPNAIDIIVGPGQSQSEVHVENLTKRRDKRVGVLRAGECGNAVDEKEGPAVQSSLLSFSFLFEHLFKSFVAFGNDPAPCHIAGVARLHLGKQRQADEQTRAVR
jgi:hypothetical protein